MWVPSAVTVYRVLSVGAFVGVLFEGSWRRLIWGAFCAFLFVSSEKFKDVEKIKRKERDLTEIRMKHEMLDGWDKSLGERYTFTIQQIASAFENAMKQLSTYVRSTSPQPGVDEYVIQAENGSNPTRTP